jgi:hypothetical protein
MKKVSIGMCIASQAFQLAKPTRARSVGSDSKKVRSIEILLDGLCGN